MATPQQEHRHHHQDQTSRIFCELSYLALNLLRSPPSPPPPSSSWSPVPFPDEGTAAVVRRRSVVGRTQMTPSGFASLMLGVSLSLMVCGSVTFFIGFMLMPWVLFLVMFFYVVGVVSTLSVLGRSFFGSVLSSRKDVPAWKLM